MNNFVQLAVWPAIGAAISIDSTTAINISVGLLAACFIATWKMSKIVTKAQDTIAQQGKDLAAFKKFILSLPCTKDEKCGLAQFKLNESENKETEG